MFLRGSAVYTAFIYIYQLYIRLTFYFLFKLVNASINDKEILFYLISVKTALKNDMLFFTQDRKVREKWNPFYGHLTVEIVRFRLSKLINIWIRSFLATLAFKTWKSLSLTFRCWVLSIEKRFSECRML